VKILESLPHRAWLQNLFSSHRLRESSSFRYQLADALRKISLELVLYSLLPTRQDVPIPPLLNPVLLVATCRFRFYRLEVSRLTLLGFSKSVDVGFLLGECVNSLLI
jgi:hypothetical protein